MVKQSTLEAIYDEVKKVNERLGLIETVIEEIIITGLPKAKLTKEELDEIRTSIEEMKRGEGVDLEALKGA
jgi:hypothetical protein